MQRIVRTARRAPRSAAATGSNPVNSLPPPPPELVLRVTRFHATERTCNSIRKKQDEEEHARSVLRWMQQSPKCRDELDLKRMVDQYITERTPLAYILGSQPFGNIDVLIEPPILIPRPETEEWTMRLLQQMTQSRGDLSAPARVLDLCSGSGCIGLAIAKKAPDFFVTGLDVSEKGINLARKNAERLNIQNAIFKKVDIFDDKELESARLTKYDLIVSNPPYIPPAHYADLDRSVKDHEDMTALVGSYRNPSSRTSFTPPAGSGEAGLDFYYRIRELASRLLSPIDKRVFSKQIPSLVLEFGMGQADDVKKIFENYKCIVRKDFNDIERTIEVYDQDLRTKRNPRTMSPIVATMKAKTRP